MGGEARASSSSASEMTCSFVYFLMICCGHKIRPGPGGEAAKSKSLVPSDAATGSKKKQKSKRHHRYKSKSKTDADEAAAAVAKNKNKSGSGDAPATNPLHGDEGNKKGGER